MEDGTKALQGKKTYENWQEGFCQIFEAVQENKPFIMNIYRCVDRQKIESYLNKLTYQLIADVVEEKCAGMQVAEEHKELHCRILQIRFCGCDVRLDRPGNEGRLS